MVLKPRLLNYLYDHFGTYVIRYVEKEENSAWADAIHFERFEKSKQNWNDGKLFCLNLYRQTSLKFGMVFV